MGERGRKSKDELSVVRPDFKKPRAPAELNAAQTKIWDATVASEPSDWFATASTKHMLKHYCIAMAEADRLSATLLDFKDAWLKTRDGIQTYKLISDRVDAQLAIVVKLARSLRLTNQSRYRADAAGAATKKKQAQMMPWEFDGQNEPEAE